MQSEAASAIPFYSAVKIPDAHNIGLRDSARPGPARWATNASRIRPKLTYHSAFALRSLDPDSRLSTQRRPPSSPPHLTPRRAPAILSDSVAPPPARPFAVHAVSYRQRRVSTPTSPVEGLDEGHMRGDKHIEDDDEVKRARGKRETSSARAGRK